MLNFWEMNEVVKGFRIIKQSGAPYKDLGQHGWFRVYSMGGQKQRTDDEITALYNQLPDVIDGMDKDAWVAVDKNFQSLHYQNFPDEFAESFDGKLVDETSQRLQSLGFKKMNANIIFVDGLTHASEKGVVQGEFMSDWHAIRVPKNLPENRMMHVIAHEWAHQFWKSLDKQSKSEFTKYYFSYTFGSSQKIGAYSETSAEELFCELVGTAVASPSAVPTPMMKLLKTIASGVMPSIALQLNPQ